MDILQNLFWGHLMFHKKSLVECVQFTALFSRDIAQLESQDNSMPCFY